MRRRGFRAAGFSPILRATQIGGIGMGRAALLFSLALTFAPHAAAEKFSMIPGVECDRDAQLCTDERGPSVGLTRLYLGDEAADRLLATLEALDDARPPAPTEPAEPTIHYPKRGVACDDLVETCYTAKGHHNGMTKATYGSDAVKSLARRAALPPGDLDAIVRPGRGEVCDRSSQTCYSDGRADASLTRLQFGADAAAGVEARSP